MLQHIYANEPSDHVPLISYYQCYWLGSWKVFQHVLVRRDFDELANNQSRRESSAFVELEDGGACVGCSVVSSEFFSQR